MNSQRRFYILAAALTFTAIAVLAGTAEIYLRYKGQLATYCEQIGVTCRMFSEKPLIEPWLFVRARKGHFRVETKEFHMDLFGNSLGLNDKEVTLAKDANEFRVVILGDSFTEGFGASKGNGYVDLLRKYFEDIGRGRKITVMNAGIAGSDPVFYLELLQRKLAAYGPDLVLMTMNVSDVTDIKRRGGSERFDEKGALKPVPQSHFAWLFEHSRLVRAYFLNILNYNWDLRTPSEDLARTSMAIDALVKSGMALQDLSKKLGFSYFVVFHPYSYEILEGKIRPDLEAVEQRLIQNHVSVLNLFAGFARKIPVEKINDYYWPIDGHCNDKGYRVFADVLWDELKNSKALTSIRKI